MGCVSSPPLWEYAKAKEALKHSEKHRAQEHSMRYYKASKRNFKKAKRLFKDRYYGAAKTRLEDAIEQAEKSEELARVKKIREEQENLY